MIATPNSSSLQNNRFPFASQVVTPTHPNQSSKSPITSGVENTPYSGDGLRGPTSGFVIDPNSSSSSHKKKRGRPRKYSPDAGGNNIALGLAPTPISPGIGGGQADSGGTAPSSENVSKKHRGRPAGSSKKQLDALGELVLNEVWLVVVVGLFDELKC